MGPAVISVGTKVKVIAAMCQNWPDPEDRKLESELVSKYLWKVGVLVRSDDFTPIPNTVRFEEAPMWGEHALAPEMRFRDFELSEV